MGQDIRPGQGRLIALGLKLIRPRGVVLLADRDPRRMAERKQGLYKRLQFM